MQVLFFIRASFPVGSFRRQHYVNTSGTETKKIRKAQDAVICCILRFGKGFLF